MKETLETESPLKPKVEAQADNALAGVLLTHHRQALLQSSLLGASPLLVAGSDPLGDPSEEQQREWQERLEAGEAVAVCYFASCWELDQLARDKTSLTGLSFTIGSPESDFPPAVFTLTSELANSALPDLSGCWQAQARVSPAAEEGLTQ